MVTILPLLHFPDDFPSPAALPSTAPGKCGGDRLRLGVIDAVPLGFEFLNLAVVGALDKCLVASGANLVVAAETCELF